MIMSTRIDGLAATGRVHPAFCNHAAGLLQRLAAGARRRWDAYWDRRARRATVLMLESLDDRTLRDIGLSRSEIRSAVFGGDVKRRPAYQPGWHLPAG
jgi:uncharacterized protein YjiS (DUF1127 family)